MHKVADAVMEKGVDYVEQKMGIKLKPEDQLTEDYVKSLQEATMKHAEFMAEIDAKDRDSARKAHVELATNANVPLLDKLTMPILALGTVGLAFVLIAVLIFRDVPESQENIIIFALGFITSAATQVLSFYFGSSQGSKDKSSQLNGLKK
jgi:hypothetical protein